MKSFIDRKYKGHELQYLIQAVMAGLAVATVLILFDVVDHPAIIAAFGSSVFVVFTLPHRDYSRPRRLIGGYIIGIGTGCLFHVLAVLPTDDYMMELLLHIVAGSLAVAISMFLMTILELEHAPAAGIALGFAINEKWIATTPIKVFLGIVVIVLIKQLIKKKLMDLI